jgi:serine phosphatase RsbU (regulator of sigma subunit)
LHFQRFFHRILGHPEKFPFNHRIANAVILIGIFLGIQSSIFNSLLNLPPFTVYATLGTSIVLIICYYLSRFKTYFYLPVLLLLFVSILIYTPFMWIANGGSAGGYQYYVFIYATFVIAVIPNRKAILLILVIILVVSVSLLIFEFYFPEDIFTYPSREDRLFDLIISFSSVLIGVSALFYVYTTEYIKKNEELSKKNDELQMHIIEVERQRNQIEDQKKKLEIQNYHINEGISYAHKIQKAVLPSYDILKRNTVDSFILYLPKEKISGDFYYFEKIHDYFVIMIADSTGHGIPGGFMSMLGLTMTEEILKRNEIKDSASVLNIFREKVIFSLEQFKPNTVTNDGFDAAVCVINTKKKEINYAGANIPLILVRNKKALYTEADNMPVGRYISSKSFTNKYIKLRSNDAVYLFTDGITDQFGGQNTQKFGYNRLEKMLIRNSDENFAIQKERLKKAHRQWKGHKKRTDDALIIGFKLY